MKPLKERIEIEQALLDGGDLQWSSLGGFKFHDIPIANANDFVFDWDEKDYRIKPEPVEYWIRVWDARKGDTTETYISAEGDTPCFNKEYDEIKQLRTIKVREVL